MSDNRPLLQQVADEKFLYYAWKLLNKSNSSSKGLSNISIKDFTENIFVNISNIHKQLLSNTYRFSSVKAVTITKSNGGLRPLRIGEISDRLVQKALALKLDELLAQKYDLDNEYSFAYRKSRNVEKAIQKMVFYYNEGHHYILEADIKKFFDTVDKNSLIQQIQIDLSDGSLNQLLLDAVSQKIGNKNNIPTKDYEDYFACSEDGIPQGNALSPLLANIYLSAFDKRMKTHNMKMVRYADDFVIMCKNKKEAEEAYNIAKDELENNLKLELYPLDDPRNDEAKSRIVNPSLHKFSFLSIRFDGIRLWVKDKKVKSIMDKIKLVTENGDNKDLLSISISLKNVIEGWIAAYCFVDLTKEVKEIDILISRRLYLVLSNLGMDLNKKTLIRTKLKPSNNDAWILNHNQRINLGIPFCDRLWERMKEKRDKSPITLS